MSGANLACVSKHRVLPRAIAQLQDESTVTAPTMPTSEPGCKLGLDLDANFLSQ